jgi:metal-sulfur cluster biosynthetic enzyme
MLDDGTREVWAALDQVLDPCSRFNGTNLSFVALGMVDGVEVAAGGLARIRLLLDDPTCLYMVEIYKQVREAVLSVPGITEVEVSLRTDELWTNERLTSAARATLGRRPPGRQIPLSVGGAAA